MENALAVKSEEQHVLPQEILKPHLPKVTSAEIHSFLEDHKIFDVTVLDLQGKTSIADTMIIATGRSQKHISVIAELLREELKQMKGKVLSIEGLPGSDWILIDAGDIIIHLFKPEVRALYNLEKMWGQPIDVAL